MGRQIGRRIESSDYNASPTSSEEMKEEILDGSILHPSAILRKVDKALWDFSKSPVRGVWHLPGMGLRFSATLSHCLEAVHRKH